MEAWLPPAGALKPQEAALRQHSQLCLPVGHVWFRDAASETEALSNRVTSPAGAHVTVLSLGLLIRRMGQRGNHGRLAGGSEEKGQVGAGGRAAGRATRAEHSVPGPATCFHTAAHFTHILSLPGPWAKSGDISGCHGGRAWKRFPATLGTNCHQVV